MNEQTPTEMASDKEESDMITAVKLLFETERDLATNGTPEQYYQYLDTIFPETCIPDILYHGTRNGKFDTFKTTGSTDHVGRLGAMAGSLKAANLMRDFQERPEYIHPDAAWEQPPLPDGSHLFILKFNITNPYKAPTLDDAIELDRATLIAEGYDGIIIEGYERRVDGSRKLTGYGTEYIVFQPEQIHILNSDAGIKKFKRFAEGKQSIPQVVLRFAKSLSTMITRKSD